MSGRRKRKQRKGRAHKRKAGERAGAKLAAGLANATEAGAELGARAGAELVEGLDPIKLAELEQQRRLARLAELHPEHDKAVDAHAELFAIEAKDYAHLRAVHLAAERVWALRAAICYELGQHDAARKASTTANEHARQAARLEQNSLADRVAALELEMTAARDLGRELDEV